MDAFVCCRLCQLNLSLIMQRLCVFNVSAGTKSTLRFLYLTIKCRMSTDFASVSANSQSVAPVVFIGHGSPMNALGDNPFFENWQKIGEQLRNDYPNIQTVLCVSAHWQTKQNVWSVMGDTEPTTIHDFGGFPAALYQQQYPAKGNPLVAASLTDYLENTAITAHTTKHPTQYTKYKTQLSMGEWGFDHGVWTVLQALYPDANVEVVPLALNGGLPNATAMQTHYAYGQAIAKWCKIHSQEPKQKQKPTENHHTNSTVLILGSGNVVHNFGLMYVPPTHTMWQQAHVFDALVEKAINNRESHKQLWEIDNQLLHNSHPTLEHYLPLLVCAGASHPTHTITHHTAGNYPSYGIPVGMRSVTWL